MAYIYDWQRMTGAPADNDLVAMIDVSDKAMSADGSNKVLEGRYIVYATDGVATSLNGGGTINLGGHTFNIADGGTLDLNDNTMTIGGNLTTDGAVTIAGAVFTYNGIGLTMTSAAAFDLGGVTLTVSGDTLAIDGTPIASYDPGGTLDLGGSSMSADGAGNLTLDGNVIDTSAVMEGTAGATNEVATFDASGDLQGGNLIGGGANALTLTASTAPATLEVKSSGTLNLNSQVLTTTGTGTLDLGISRTLAVKDGDMTLRGGGELDLDGNNLSLQVGNVILKGGGASTVDLSGHSIAVRTGSMTLHGGTGSALNLAGFTVTAAKDGTIAMLDDLTGVSTLTSYVCYARSDTGHNYNSYEDKGGMVWEGSVHGTKSATLIAGYEQVGSGTCYARLYDETNAVVLGTVSAAVAGFNVLKAAIVLPANDAVITAQLYTSTGTTYMWVRSIQVNVQ